MSGVFIVNILPHRYFGSLHKNFTFFSFTVKQVKTKLNTHTSQKDSKWSLMFNNMNEHDKSKKITLKFPNPLFFWVCYLKLP